LLLLHVLLLLHRLHIRLLLGGCILLAYFVLMMSDGTGRRLY
jgi:hypothetical protein